MRQRVLSGVLFSLLIASILLFFLLPSRSGVQNESVQIPEGMASAVFAGGCFWCTEADFEKVFGVQEVISGYAGGSEPSPTYAQVSAGITGHREAVLVLYDPSIVSYRELVDYFWRHIDPMDEGGSFVDRGMQYTSAIWYRTEEELQQAEHSRAELIRLGIFTQPIVTPFLPFTTFYLAEDYHQNYSRVNALKYQYYRARSGRDAFLEATWGTPFSGSSFDEVTLRERLTAIQYAVTQENATEPPFKNMYWDMHDAGLYVDVVSGEPLFSSLDKYDSGTGWPSFTRPLDVQHIEKVLDTSLFSTRVEIRGRVSNAHLGHLFSDGPALTGLRYCMNSASLRFVPLSDFEEEGYGQYRGLFNSSIN
ncbi:peptide-methionine (R)-S-oxide reductase [Candidatus Pacearchaeota archaeon]|nr:peptide-methionine (R)-S-oxide reductase [Candidatus Pacearchaeota archaeon]